MENGRESHFKTEADSAGNRFGEARKDFEGKGIGIGERKKGLVDAYIYFFWM
jgi:hypothetical protein